ncbi:MAG: LemA family protein [Pseudomonadota bacterium]
MSVLMTLIGIFIVLVIFAVSIYNRLIELRNRFKNAYSQIDVQLQRRYELIPNIIETAKAYLTHERETLTQVIEARNQAVSVSKIAAQNPNQIHSLEKLGQAESFLNQTLGKLFAVSEAYPDLKANESMASLTEELSSTENKIAFARQAFNDDVMIYNTYREMFPNSLIAGTMHFKEAPLLEISDEKARQPIAVKF